MSLIPLKRRLEKIEQGEAKRPGLVRPIRIITESDEDRDRQLADLEQAGLYTPGSLVIDRRIVDPAPKEA